MKAKLRKPKLTDKVIRGIITTTSIIEAGGLESFGGPEMEHAESDFDDAMRARDWAFAMRAYLDEVKRQTK